MDGVVLCGIVHIRHLGYVVSPLSRVVDVLLELLPPRVHEEERLAARGHGSVLQLGEAALGHGPARGGRGEGVHPGGGGRRAHVRRDVGAEALLPELSGQTLDEVDHQAEELEGLLGDARRTPRYRALHRTHSVS